MYLELLRRDYKVTVGRTGDKAIDFVCDKSGEKLYVQVAYLLASDETVQREFGAYNNIRDNYPKYDETSGYVKTPSKQLNDALVEAFKDRLKAD